MMCLGWAKGVECGAMAAREPTAVAGCPNVNWFWWLAAGAVALGLVVRSKRRRTA